MCVTMETLRKCKRVKSGADLGRRIYQFWKKPGVTSASQESAVNNSRGARSVPVEGNHGVAVSERIIYCTDNLPTLDTYSPECKNRLLSSHGIELKCCQAIAYFIKLI
jgi:hypothetical protein